MVVMVMRRKTEMDFDEFARDEFSCFRGLVLDISYRSVTFSMFSMLFFLSSACKMFVKMSC